MSFLRNTFFQYRLPTSFSLFYWYELFYFYFLIIFKNYLCLFLKDLNSFLCLKYAFNLKKLVFFFKFVRFKTYVVLIYICFSKLDHIAKSDNKISEVVECSITTKSREEEKLGEQVEIGKRISSLGVGENA